MAGGAWGWDIGDGNQGPWIAANRLFLDAVRKDFVIVKKRIGVLAGVLFRRTVKSTTPIRRYKPGGRK